MDKDSDVVDDQKKALGCKVTHDLIHPDMCVVSDKVGGNISMKGDGHIGETKLICEKGTVVQRKISNKEKHFTVMGFTLLSGQSLICMIIMSGKRYQFLT